jgi:hypothetical protein
MIFTPALAPIRVARPRQGFGFFLGMNAARALTPMFGPTVLRISSISCTVAPPPEKAVDVFYVIGTRLFGQQQATTFSSSVNKDVSMMTLVNAPAR